MRDIPQIKKQAQSVTEIKKIQVNPISTGADQKEQAHVLAKFSQKVAQRKREIRNLDEEIEEKKRISIDTGKQLVQKAQEESTILLAEAKRQLDLGKSLAEKNKTIEKQLEEFDITLQEREKQAQKLEKTNTQQLDEIRQAYENIDHLLKSGEEFKELHESMLLNTIQLHDSAVEQLKQAQELNNTLSLESAQKLTEAGKILERVALLVKEIDADKAYLKQKAAELQKEKVYLADRRALLQRAQEEMKQK